MKSVAKTSTLVTLGVLLAAAGTIAGLELSNTTHWFHAAPRNVITTAGKTLPLAKPNSSSNNSAGSKANSSGSKSTADGYATDTSGRTPVSTNESQWITSQSGVITIKQPVANATLANGATLAGTTTSTGPIHFILLDNSTGQIATGTLNVVNGNFSGQLTFQTHSSSGQLDVFTTSANGREQNLIEIGVNFSQ